VIAANRHAALGSKIGHLEVGRYLTRFARHRVVLLPRLSSGLWDLTASTRAEIRSPGVSLKHR
jgi:hypothetical protein